MTTASINNTDLSELENNLVVVNANMEIKKELGKKLKAKRKDFGYSQQQLANKTGLHINTISNLERGEQMNIETLQQILDEYGLDICFCSKNENI